MGSYKTANEVEQDNVRLMGPDLGPLFDRLDNECCSLQLTWTQYVELFGTTPERVDLLNQTAGLFFRIVQDTLWENSLLRLACLTDTPKSGRKDNLTIQRLPPLLKIARARRQTQQLVEKAVDATAFARDWRNRHIAHRDLALSLGQGAQPLAPASRKQVKEAIAAVYAVIMDVHAIYCDSDLRLDFVRAGAGDAETLLYVLQRAVEAREARTQRLRDGNPRPEDLGPPRAI